MNLGTFRECSAVLPIAAVLVALAVAGCQTTQGTRPDVETTTTAHPKLDPVMDVASRKAALAKMPPHDRWLRCQSTWWKRADLGQWIGIDLARKATLHGPIRLQKSNAHRTGNALFGDIVAYYEGDDHAAERIRDTLEAGARIDAFTEIAPYSPSEYSGYNPMNEPVWQVANFLIPLAHAYLILEEEYPENKALLSDVKRWGDRLFRSSRDARDDFQGKSGGIDRRALIAAGWAFWANAANNQDALAQAKRYYNRALRSVGRGGADRKWHHKGKDRIYYANMTFSAALVAAYALRRSGVDDVYTAAPAGGTIVEGAAWLWNALVEGGHTDLLRTRSPGSRNVAWIELFIREFPGHPATAGMRSWIADSPHPLYGNMNGGPTTCLYRRL